MNSATVISLSVAALPAPQRSYTPPSGRDRTRPTGGATVLAFKRPLRSALVIAISLTQIGEFSFILAALAAELHLFPAGAMNALVFCSIVSITLNPLLFKGIAPTMGWLERRGFVRPASPETIQAPLLPSPHQTPS